jgi:methyl-accepting chemotaxis protein
LSEVFKDIIAAIDQSNSDTRELSGATDDMARRTEQQAAALEETAAAIEQISTISKQSSERTREVRTVVDETSEQAARSGETVTEAIAAMGKIEESSKKITQIITVIDEISFQTNLLALNAGVEAARAGEAGKGFAVVAQEVRELAQRSASAAKEIKDLIEASFEDVLKGVSLVNRTGEALTSIGGQVQVISEHFVAISQSAQEQSAGHLGNQHCGQFDGPDHPAECGHGRTDQCGHAEPARRQPDARPAGFAVHRFRPEHAGAEAIGLREGRVRLFGLPL